MYLIILQLKPFYIFLKILSKLISMYGGGTMKKLKTAYTKKN